MLQNIRIVLVETSHTGNMGSVARAMKTMGLTNLWLVNPLVKPDSQAIALAAGASDVIGNAHIVDTLDEALAGCSLVVGTSARSRTLPWPMLDPRECGLKSVAEAANTPVALVFGRERVGLTNEELQKCHYHVAIAANPEYSSLNLAMAVQVIAYEVRMAWLATQENGEQVEHEETPYPLVDDLVHDPFAVTERSLQINCRKVLIAISATTKAVINPTANIGISPVVRKPQLL